jgi:extracellular elastinolytic metalloproteinase
MGSWSVSRTLCAASILGLAFVSSASAQESAAVVTARAYLQAHAAEWGLTPADIADVVVSSEVFSKHNRVTHVYLQQRRAGVPVAGALLTVNVSPLGHVIYAANRFINLAPAAPAQPVHGAVEAVEAAARHLNLTPTRAPRLLGQRRAAAGRQTVLVSDAGLSRTPIAATLVYLQHESGLRLAWQVEIEEISGRHWWSAYVDAETGESLGAEDLIVHDSADAIAAAVARPRRAARAPRPASGASSAFPATDGAVYNVFGLPLESPNDGPRAPVSNAADPAGSPLGWHNTGLPGGAFQVTRGNNAHAYTDLNADNVADPGSDPSGGPALQFDFPLDLGQGPETYRPFAVANLFYWNNIMHDVQHRYGFDEAAGNFQVNNFGNGQLGNDDVRAEAQDGSGTNNANFGTNVDGVRPRMQMFVWTHPQPLALNVPAGPAAGDYIASRATFGPQLVVGNPPLAGTLTLVDDGVIGAGTPPGTLNDGCEPFTVPAGSIALVERGFCTFAVKAFNAQNTGAIAVVVINNVPGNPGTMGFTPPIPTITIPAAMITLDAGTLIRANTPTAGALRADATRATSRDSDLDAGVIAHEYGHGISNRLTGGPNVVGCLNNAEQMGEGWSDWQALFVTGDPADRVDQERGIGPYVVFQDSDGAGIRPTPYSTDMAVNPSTYLTINNPAIVVPHGIGYVWNTMLWEMHWNLVDRYGFNRDVYGAWNTGGNNMAHQLVTDGMKFQHCRPGMVDGRDAILSAEKALTSGSNTCEIWRAFAKRGLGFGASQGSNTDRFDGTESFALPAECTAATFGGFQPPVSNAPALNLVNAGSTVPLKFTVTGAPAGFPIDSQQVDCTTLIPTGEAPQPIASALSRLDGRQHINWRTQRSWEGTCRRVTLRVPAATDPVAYFRFH